MLPDLRETNRLEEDFAGSASLLEEIMMTFYIKKPRNSSKIYQRFLRLPRRRQLLGLASGFAAAWLTVAFGMAQTAGPGDAGEPSPPAPTAREAGRPPSSFGELGRPTLPPDSPVFDLDPRYSHPSQYTDSVYSFFPAWCRRWRDLCITCMSTDGFDRVCTTYTCRVSISGPPWCEEFDSTRVPELCRAWSDGTYRYDRTGRIGRERTRLPASVFCVDWDSRPGRPAAAEPYDRQLVMRAPPRVGQAAASSCLLAYSDGLLCGRTRPQDGFKCILFPGGAQLFETTSDHCVRQRAPAQQCRAARLPCDDRINLETMAIRYSGRRCPSEVPIEQRVYSCEVE
ncbi:MAG: hypothetical protein ACJ8DE_18680 [Microvirga sp.]